jgi:flagellin
MVINTNISAANGARLLSESTSMLQKSLARLSSGSKIVDPEDDAAGLAVSIHFDAQINRNNAVISTLVMHFHLGKPRTGICRKCKGS